MNIVIFSYNFLPMNDAEAYCTTRFASALTYMGHSVHVVTMDHKFKVRKEVYEQLVDSQLTITRVPIEFKEKPIWTRLRFFTFEWEAINFNACIKAVKTALMGLDHPILVTRSNPIASAIVGWHCRKCANKWVAHLSDPIPIPGRELSWRNIHRLVNHCWIRRTLRDADYVSVTCPNAIRAYKDEYGSHTSRATFIVTPHIGEPKLHIGTDSASSSDEIKQIVHNGIMCAGRGAPELAKVIEALDATDYKCEFIQCGQVDDISALFYNNPLIRRMDRCDGDVEYIPDLNVPLAYCPFLSSKFVYRVYDDKPILLYTHPDSFSAELARKYPEAGIFFADNTKTDSLLRTVKTAFKCDRESIDRTGIRQEFTREKVIGDFMRFVE